MFVSGFWRGFWQQEGFGRQEMSAFELHFRNGEVKGHGTDIIGRFTFHGDYVEQSGRVRMVKQYLGKHKVYYEGQPDGEGSILGTWLVVTEFDGTRWESTGPFRLFPELRGDEPIQEL